MLNDSAKKRNSEMHKKDFKKNLGLIKSERTPKKFNNRQRKEKSRKNNRRRPSLMKQWRS